MLELLGRILTAWDTLRSKGGRRTGLVLCIITIILWIVITAIQTMKLI